MIKDEIITRLIEDEYNNANKFYKPFNSCHEAYGVILEEYEETKEELLRIQAGIEKYWMRCRNSKHVKPNTIYLILNDLEADGLDCLNEVIQILAMVKKIKKYEFE